MGFPRKTVRGWLEGAAKLGCPQDQHLEFWMEGPWEGAAGWQTRPAVASASGTSGARGAFTADWWDKQVALCPALTSHWMYILESQYPFRGQLSSPSQHKCEACFITCSPTWTSVTKRYSLCGKICFLVLVFVSYAVFFLLWILLVKVVTNILFCMPITFLLFLTYRRLNLYEIKLMFSFALLFT